MKAKVLHVIPLFHLRSALGFSAVKSTAQLDCQLESFVNSHLM